MADFYVSTTGNDTTGDGSVGNPYATPGKGLAVAIAAGSPWRVLVKAGTYNVTSTTANIAAGRLDFTQTGARNAWNVMLGYTTTVGDGGRFVLALGAGLNTTVVTMNNANSYNELRNFEITGNSTAGAAAMAIQGRSNRCQNFKVSGFSGGGAHLVEVRNNAIIRDFEISGGATGASCALKIDTSTAFVSNGDVHGNAGRGVQLDSNALCVMERVRSYGHTGANGYGFYHNAIESIFLRCTAWGNAKSNWFLGGANATMVCIECGSVNSTEYGWDNLSALDAVVLVRCHSHNNTSGAYPAAPNTLVDHQALSGAPYTDPANGDFRPNNTAGAGASIRGINAPSFLGFASYPDSGSMQHLESAGSAGGLLWHPGMSGGCNG